MSPTTRRRFVIGAGAGLLGLAALRWGIPRWMRTGPPEPLSPAAAGLVQSCLAGLRTDRVWDVHTHLVGLGSGGTGCSINPEMLSHWHPVKRFQFEVYAAAAGMADEETADADYVNRLLELHRDAIPEGRRVLLALDRFVDDRGREQPELSAFHTPDEYVLRIAAEHPEFEACASIHPYRDDALDRLDRAVGRGAVAVKWLPNAMGIDPTSPRCDPFYRALSRLDVPLLCHAGREYAVDSAEHQELGNPLRLRRALDQGVRLIVAHCGSLGSYHDIESPQSAKNEMESFDLFMRLFTDPRYEELIHGEISTLVNTHHSMRPVKELLAAPELHDRLLYGSDYPLPAIRMMTSTLLLQQQGLLTPAHRELCNEVFEANPLLFDFVVYRSLQHDTPTGSHRFSDRVFETARVYDRRSAATGLASRRPRADGTANA